MPGESITISLKEYQRLQRLEAKLSCLEAAGVDNWCGYDDAMQTLHDEYGEEL